MVSIVKGFYNFWQDPDEMFSASFLGGSFAVLIMHSLENSYTNIINGVSCMMLNSEGWTVIFIRGR